MKHQYTIKMLLKMKSYFTSNPHTETIVNYDEFRRPVTMTQQSFKTWFMECLHHKINVRGGLPMSGRRYGSQYQTELLRDAIKIREKRLHRVIIHQFNTDTCRERLAHLVDPYEF